MAAPTADRDYIPDVEAAEAHESSEAAPAEDPEVGRTKWQWGKGADLDKRTAVFITVGT